MDAKMTSYIGSCCDPRPARPAATALRGRRTGHSGLRAGRAQALNDEVRNRLAARAAVLRLETVTPYFGSLVRDPVHPSSYYLAVDGGRGEPLLLHLAPATAPTSSIFYKPLLIGRMRRPNGPESSSTPCLSALSTARTRKSSSPGSAPRSPTPAGFASRYRGFERSRRRV